MQVGHPSPCSSSPGDGVPGHTAGAVGVSAGSLGTGGGCCVPEPECLLIAPAHRSFPWDSPKVFPAKFLPMPVGHQGLSLGSRFISPYAGFGLHFLSCALLSLVTLGMWLGLELLCSLHCFPMLPHACLQQQQKEQPKPALGEFLWSCFFKK